LAEILDHKQDSDWAEDAIAVLNRNLDERKLKQVMNVADVKLNTSYNFYHSPIASEVRMIY
jgi:hypothetical protein